MNNLIDIKSLQNHFKEGIDLFISSSSFEKRCFVVAEAVKELVKDKRSLIFYNDNEYVEIISNADKLSQLLGNSAKVSLNTNNPVQNSIEMHTGLDKIFDSNHIDRILLDTTTFTHESLLIILKLLYLKREKYRELHIAYVGATDYSTKEKDESKKWLSSGISAVRTVIGYPGIISPARENHIVVLFGFESDRTKNLIESLRYDSISLGCGAKKSIIDEKLQDINHRRHFDFKNLYTNAFDFELSLIDPQEAKKDIINRIQAFPNHNTIIAPMNNKISTVGAALVAIDNPKIQLIYAKPIQYNVDGYSESRSDCYVFEIKW